MPKLKKIYLLLIQIKSIILSWQDFFFSFRIDNIIDYIVKELIKKLLPIFSEVSCFFTHNFKLQLSNFQDQY